MQGFNIRKKSSEATLADIKTSLLFFRQFWTYKEIIMKNDAHNFLFSQFDTNQ